MITKSGAGMTVVDHGGREKVNEGRMSGPSFAFLKRDGDKYETIQPISACKDFLNDVVYAELSGKTYHAYGYTASKKNIFDTHAYLAMAICGCWPYMPPDEHGKYNAYGRYDEMMADVELLNKNHQSIQAMMNWFEKKMGKEETVVTYVADNLLVLKLGLHWVETTWAISLFAFLARNSLRYKDGDAIAYLDSISGNDYMMVSAVKRKLKVFFDNKVPKQDLTINPDPQAEPRLYWHWEGIMKANI